MISGEPVFCSRRTLPEDAPGPMPHVTEENKVCPDVTEWRKYVKVPDLKANCSQGWEEVRKLQEEIRARGNLAMAFMGTGIFEQCHYLMGFEEALMNAIGEYRFIYAKLLVDNLHPDVILSRDDWGSKTSLFMSPDTWREYFKEHYLGDGDFCWRQGCFDFVGNEFFVLHIVKSKRN